MTVKGIRSSRPLYHILLEIDRSLSPGPEFAGVHLVLIHRTHKSLTMGGTATTRRPPSAPNFERIETLGDDSVARQRALVGDSVNNEQRSDDLSNPS